MELNEKEIEQLKKQPIIETVITKSEDQQWVMHKTIITMFQNPGSNAKIPRI